MVDLTNRREFEAYIKQVQQLIDNRKVGITVACCYANTYPYDTHYCSGHGAFGDGRDTKDCPSKRFCQQLHDKTFDYMGYVVKYDREYTNGEVFDKNAFKVNGPHTIYIGSVFGYDKVLGIAYLEHLDDGVVARCRFFDDDLCNFIKAGLERPDGFVLTFSATNVTRNDNHVQRGDIESVIVSFKSAVHTLKEEKEA